jgi:hypothetical protein
MRLLGQGRQSVYNLNALFGFIHLECHHDVVIQYIVNGE